MKKEKNYTFKKDTYGDTYTMSCIVIDKNLGVRRAVSVCDTRNKGEKIKSMENRLVAYITERYGEMVA